MSTATFTYTLNTISVITIGIGFIGHIVSIIVFLRKPFRANSISTYCISLGIVECLVLLRFAQNIALIAYDINSLSDLSDELCKWIPYFITLLSSIQPFIMVVFSIDKLLSMSMRTRSFPILKKKWFQLSIVAGIVLFNVAIYIYFPILIKRREVSPGRLVCDQTATSLFALYITVLLIASLILPFVIMIITSVLTIRQLIKSRNSIERVGNVGKERKLRDAKYAITSVTLNIMFIIFKMPYLVFFVLNAYLAYFDVYFFNISSFLFYFYTSSSFFVHLATNSVFRREFLLLFRFSKENEAISSNRISRTNRITPMQAVV